MGRFTVVPPITQRIRRLILVVGPVILQLVLMTGSKQLLRVRVETLFILYLCG